MTKVAMCLLLLAAGAVVAQELPEHIRACAADADDARRLACYDRAAGRSVQQTTPSAAAAAAAKSTPTSASTLSAPAATPETKFGYRGDIAREELDRREAEAQQDAPDRLEATVTEIAKQPHGQMVLTLDNGQVWEQKTAETLKIRVGDRIVIKNASMGSFLLVAPNNRTSRVVRRR